MAKSVDIIRDIERDSYNKTLEKLYGTKEVIGQKARYIKVLERDY